MHTPVVPIFWISALAMLLVTAAPLHAQPVLDAARAGDADRVTTLLQNDPGLARAVDAEGRTALHHAAARGHIDVAGVLLSAGAAIDARDQDGETPLHSAAWRNRLAMAEWLVAHGAALEAQNHWGRTPLLIVARETGNADMARVLLGAGANVTVRDRYGASSLDLAAWRGFGDLVDLLLDSGAELPPPAGRDAQQLAMSAADKGLERLFDRCVDAGVGLDLRNENDGSLLHSAAQGGSATIVSRLLDQGFDVDERDRYRRTPLHYAAELGRADAARMLLRRGADIDARSLGGETALNTARWAGREDVAELLTAAGADPAPRQFPLLRGPFMGQEPPAPDAPPQLFATDIVSTHRFQHGTVAFSPSGDEAFWSSQVALQEAGYSQGLIVGSRVVDGRWTEPAPAPFSQLGLGDDVPIYAPDGNRLYFLSRRVREGEEDRPERIWYVERVPDGWSEPRLIDGGPNSIELHWSFSVAADGSAYVGSRGDLYVSRFVDGRYREPERLAGPISSDADESMPFIAPDGSFLLFTRFGHPDNLGFADLWIAFSDGRGGWGEPHNLGERVNAMGGICPVVSSDGRYLFFNSGNDDNYWVDAGFIEELRSGG